MEMSTIITLGVVIGIVVLIATIYNRLVALRNRYKNGFSQIDVQLQRRYDLIPNLVEACKGYMKHEQDTLTEVIKARNEAESAAKIAAQNPGNGAAMKKLGGMESMLTEVLGKFKAVSEAYPELKANEQVAELMEELSSTENRVAFARQAFNDAVMAYNTYREQFPNIVVAGPTGFHHAELLELQDQEARKGIKISMT